MTYTAGPTAEYPHGGLIARSLAFSAGYVDTLGFSARFGLFTAQVTGNFVLVGSELVSPSNGVPIKLLAFPASIIGVVVARSIMIFWSVRGTPLRHAC